MAHFIDIKTKLRGMIKSLNSVLKKNNINASQKENIFSVKVNDTEVASVSYTFENKQIKLGIQNIPKKVDIKDFDIKSVKTEFKTKLSELKGIIQSIQKQSGGKKQSKHKKPYTKKGKI